MKKIVIEIMVLLVLVTWSNVVSAAVLFDETCENLDAWTGVNLARITATNGLFELSGGNTDNNVYMYTKESFLTPCNVTFSFDSARYDTGYNSGQVWIGPVGDTAHYSDHLGIGVAIAEYGDGPPLPYSQYYYNGTAYNFSTNLMPEGHWSGLAIKIEYFAANNRLLITQTGGQYWNGSGRTAASNTVLVDQIMSNAYDYKSYDKILYTANTKYKGGGIGTIDNIVIETVPCGTMIIIQ